MNSSKFFSEPKPFDYWQFLSQFSDMNRYVEVIHDTFPIDIVHLVVGYVHRYNARDLEKNIEWMYYGQYQKDSFLNGVGHWEVDNVDDIIKNKIHIYFMDILKKHVPNVLANIIINYRM